MHLTDFTQDVLSRELQDDRHTCPIMLYTDRLYYSIEIEPLGGGMRVPLCLKFQPS